MYIFLKIGTYMSVRSTIGLEQLNKQQVEAVTDTDGPLLVLAGAGTGKTKVLTMRTAHIINEGIAEPHRVLAVTFTNKAANEIKERIVAMLGELAEGIWIGTFHSMALRILRKHGELIGLKNGFNVINVDEQVKVTKDILKRHDIADKVMNSKSFLYTIDKFKNKGLSFNQIPTSENKVVLNNILFSELYEQYQRALSDYNMVDFGDIIMMCLQLFNENPEVCEQYQDKFQRIMVDEYQDTNTVQYLWLRALAYKHHNICCVGDDDQSIYGWRGAIVQNILRFEKDFENAKIIRLGLNYRSTNNILGAASTIIEKNKQRHGKSIWTTQANGEKVNIVKLADDFSEAFYVAEEIKQLIAAKLVQSNDVAILTRAGYQTRSFEDSLNRFNIHYQIVGGLRFYDRMEVKNAIAYCRLLHNPNDSLAFMRIVNMPKRGIGATTMENIELYAMDQGIPVFSAAKEMLSNKNISGKACKALEWLVEQVEQWRKSLDTVPHHILLAHVLEQSGYMHHIREDAANNPKERLENIQELLGTIKEHGNLSAFIEHINIATDLDNLGHNKCVKIMTMHAAKGLEFNTVFLVGWEEGVFPNSRAIYEDRTGDSLEEERRLAYVGITRAKQRLYITHAARRAQFSGGFQYSKISRFIEEISPSYCNFINKK